MRIRELDVVTATLGRWVGKAAMGNSETVWDSSNTRIVVDSSSNVPAQLRSQYRMIEAPTLVNFGTESYRNNVDMSSAEFYQRFAESDQIPTTSQPPPAYFRRRLSRGLCRRRRAHRGGDGEPESCQVPLPRHRRPSSCLTDDGLRHPRLDDERFLFWDGESISMGSGWQAIAAARMLEEGIERAELIATFGRDSVGDARLCHIGHAQVRGVERAHQQLCRRASATCCM